MLLDGVCRFGRFAGVRLLAPQGAPAIYLADFLAGAPLRLAIGGWLGLTEASRLQKYREFAYENARFKMSILKEERLLFSR